MVCISCMSLCCQPLIQSQLFMLGILYYVHKVEAVFLMDNTGMDDKPSLHLLASLKVDLKLTDLHRSVRIINITVNHN